MRSYLLRPLQDHTGFLAARRFPAFDGIRALAALMVIAFHFGGPRWSFLSGWLGVHLFFVLSGFLITTLLLREEGAQGHVSLGRFWVRRVFRIIPAYYSALAATVFILAMNGTMTDAGVPRSILWFLTINPEFAPTAMNFGQAWTIGFEQKFYLLWPVLGFVLVVGMATRRALVWFACFIATILLCLIQISFVHFAVILLGCGVALALHCSKSYKLVRLLRTRLIGATTLVCLVVVQINSELIASKLVSEAGLILLYGSLVALCIPALTTPSTTSTLLGAPLLRWLGDRSYSIYLLQLVAGSAVTALFPSQNQGTWLVILVTASTILLADANYRYVEAPSIALGKRLTNSRAAPFVRRGAPSLSRTIFSSDGVAKGSGRP